MFDESIKFKYSWRPYQAKVLETANQLIKDKKVHVVAPPGSGKTVLGLELIRRIGEACLILSPTVTIKNQWIDRFVSLFMIEGGSKPEWISDDVYHLNYFNSITYQGLHCAYKRLTKVVTDEDDTDDEVLKEVIDTDIDVKTYNLIKELKSHNIKTIVLDEAHHLKNEWWNSLIKVIEAIGDVVIVSLTATPPFDIPQNEWNRYISLCGDIDAEISVPELVKKKNLCPHQDYVYFSYPTNDEKEMILKYQNDVEILKNELVSNVDFINLIRNHPYVVDNDVYIEEILDNPRFYSSLLIFLNEVGVDVTKEHTKVLGKSKIIPKLDTKWLEILLQNIIFDSRDTFKDIEFLSLIEKKLNEIGAIEKKEVLLTSNSNLQKYFINSIGKLDSIVSIVKSEYACMHSKLRMVILTDYLRKEYLEIDNPKINKIGVFPILIKLLNENININIGVLTGSIFMIPKVKKDKLLELAVSEGIDKDKIIFQEVNTINDYLVVKSIGKLKSKVMNLISKLFSIGELNIIIGTKSLLGEGWDEQCINSLILASFVGSYVLSNQMRGRAIRVSNDPEKTANIWHLVCVDEINKDLIENPDYELMKRRFNAFIGIGYIDNVIESGIDRLDIIPTSFNRESVDNYNAKLINLSNARMEMYNRWFSLVNNEDCEKFINDEIIIEKDNLKNDFSFIQISKIFWFVVSSLIMFVILNVFVSNGDIFEYFWLVSLIFLVLLIFNVPFIIQCVRKYLLSIPENQLLFICKCLIRSLCQKSLIDTLYYKIKIVINSSKEESVIRFRVDGVTSRERVLIIKSLEEMFSKEDDQRYILVNKGLFVLSYYNVPSVLSTNKKMATKFYRNWNLYIGVCNLIYTKSAAGRKILLKAKSNSFIYANGKELFKSKKKAISAFK